MRKTLGAFQAVGVTVDVVPVVRTLDEMDLHLRAKVGKKSYMKTVQVKMVDNFEADLKCVLEEATSGVIELIRRESPELFLKMEKQNGASK